MSSLPRLTAINDTYAVGRVLQKEEAFGIFYRGWNVNTEKEVFIREYFPRELAQRKNETTAVSQEGQEELFQYGLEQFLDEASVLQQIRHDNIVSEVAHVETHGTAYQIFEQEPGASLQNGLERKGGVLPERAALAILMPVLDGLERLHREGLVHGGVSPNSIFLAKSGRPLLQDVQSAQVQLARRTQQLQEVLTPGYASPEQFLSDSRIGPWMDVYGCGAVLYRVLSGETLPVAKERLQHDPLPDRLEQLEGTSNRLRRALQQILALNPSERPSSIKALRTLLEDPPAKEDATPEPPLTESEEPEEAAPTADEKEETGSPDDDRAQQEPSSADSGADTSTQTDEVQESEEQTSESTGESEIASSLSTSESSPATPSPASDRSAQEHGERDEVPSRAERRSEKSGSTPLYAGAAVLVMALLGGGLFFFLNDDPAQAQPSQAVLLTRQADSLFERGQFTSAKARYEQVLIEKPGDPYAERRIVEAETQLEKINEQQYYARLNDGDSLLARGNKLVIEGDSGQARKMLEKANQKFLKALNNKPNDSLALARVKTVTSSLFPERQTASSEESQDEEETSSEQEGEAFQEQMFTYLRDQADRLFEKGEYVASRGRYQEALDLNESEYVQNKIDEIDELVAEQEREERYVQSMQRGRDYLADDELRAAQAAFEQALIVKPEDSTAQQQLDRVKTEIAKENDQQKYQGFRAQGEEHMEQDELQAAVKSFEQALEYKPADTYVQEQVAEAKKRIREKEHQEKQARRVDGDGIYKVPDEVPSMVGSIADLAEEMTYPERAYKERVEGRVFLRFVVNEEGRVTRAETVPGRELGYGTDEEAMRAIKEMRFEPATVDGEPVKAWHTMMIRFQSSDFD